MKYNVDLRIKSLDEQLEREEERAEKYRRMYIDENDKVMEYRRYKMVFEMLVAEIKK